jgi:hypothetical protein
MRVISFHGHIFDLDSVASTRLETASVLLTFRNGNRIHLSWRDNCERTAVLKALELASGSPADLEQRL